MTEPRRPPTLSGHLRWVLVVSLVEIPFLVAGGLLFALGGNDDLEMLGASLIALTAASGAAVIAFGIRRAARRQDDDRG